MSKIVKTKRIDRFTRSKTVQESYKSFSFGNSIKSYNNPQIYFTNFVKSKENSKYKKLEEYVIKLLDGDSGFVETDFGMLDEIKYTKSTGSRLLDIINKGYGHKYKPIDLKYIFKTHHNTKKGFELYIKNSHGNLTVLLIDVFHLAIGADRYVGKKYVIPKNLKRDYNCEKGNCWDLSNIL